MLGWGDDDRAVVRSSDDGVLRTRSITFSCSNAGVHAGATQSVWNRGRHLVHLGGESDSLRCRCRWYVCGPWPLYEGDAGTAAITRLKLCIQMHGVHRGKRETQPDPAQRFPRTWDPANTKPRGMNGANGRSTRPTFITDSIRIDE